MTRSILAFLAAPFWSAVFLVVFAHFIWQAPDFLGPDGQRPAWVGMALVIGLAAGSLCMALLGLPAHLALRRHGHTDRTTYVLTFMGLGLLAWLLMFLGAAFFDPFWDLRTTLTMLADTFMSHPIVPLTACLLGGLVGASFWFIARPDQGPDPLLSRTVR
ncbi:Uncharacterised protein [Bordetella ansorpii]|uniref:Uncharacterized protein n=1 Tax=Bordetella ansorpii TaxID=288768 RepID=A0A157NV27_9BORD|nr:hypothetical protein [Bordetella ansorpii]SAI24940.1 Uncharacterised protein [Bordetella ansorpii]